VEKGIFTKEEFLEMIRVVDQKMKKNERENHERTLFACYSLGFAMERCCLMESGTELSEGLVCGNADHSNAWHPGNSLYIDLSEEQEHGSETFQFALAKNWSNIR
jgi:hypothetical protein